VVRSEELLARLRIPANYWDWIAASWQRGERHLYGRMDFAYSGKGHAKLLELNYDTPTSLYEAAYFQWLWLEDQIRAGQLPEHADQYNAIQDLLIQAWGDQKRELPRPVYFASVRDHIEDRGTILYLRDCAAHAGIETQIIDIEDIGLSSEGHFTDLDDRVIRVLFKLYPLEFMFEEEFGARLPRSGVRLIEPPWKAILSNKGALALLWERHAGHPNLLETHFDDGESALAPGWVRKPLLSREGANVRVRLPGGEEQEEPGSYDDGGFVRQAYAPLPRFGDVHAVIGAWMIGDAPAGMGIREDLGLITRDTARFVPHVIVNE
jgi:glutathionylspermidine synthase